MSADGLMAFRKVVAAKAFKQLKGAIGGFTRIFRRTSAVWKYVIRARCRGRALIVESSTAPRPVRLQPISTGARLPGTQS
jgi:hypothetical protein